MTGKIQTLLMLLAMISTLAACSKGGDRSARDAGSPAVVSGSSCASSQQSVGRVYDDGSAPGSTFEQRVKGLLSATVDPQYFGTISGDVNNAQTGVTMEGHLSFDSAGNVVIAQTRLKLTVTDSFVGQKDSTGATILAYPINFSNASSGTVNLATKTFTVLFKDNYGEVSITGTLGASTTTGTVRFANSTSYNNSTPASGILGAFTISTCAWTN